MGTQRLSQFKSHSLDAITGAAEMSEPTFEQRMMMTYRRTLAARDSNRKSEIESKMLAALEKEMEKIFGSYKEEAAAILKELGDDYCPLDQHTEKNDA